MKWSCQPHHCRPVLRERGDIANERRAGERCFQMQLTKAAVDALVRLDLLNADQRGDTEAVRYAVLALCHVGYQTLSERRRGPMH
jgi:hypothetical protein